MYLWYYSTRAFARNSFHATRPEIHGARQICIQSYNINNVFLHFIISRRIHAAFCTVVVFVSAALYSEASGLQPTKYAVRPEILQFPGLTAYFCFLCPKAMDLSLFFSLLSSGFRVSRSYFSSVDPRQPSPDFLTNVFWNKKMCHDTFSHQAGRLRHVSPSRKCASCRRAKSTLSSVFLYRNIPHPDVFFYNVSTQQESSQSRRGLRYSTPP